MYIDTNTHVHICSHEFVLIGIELIFIECVSVESVFLVSHVITHNNIDFYSSFDNEY